MNYKELKAQFKEKQKQCDREDTLKRWRNESRKKVLKQLEKREAIIIKGDQ